MIAELKHQNSQIDQKQTPEQLHSPDVQFSAAFVAQQNKWTSWANDSAKAFSTSWQGATNAVSDGFTHLFLYGAQKGQWFKEIWNGVISSMVSSMTQLVVNWAMNHIIMQGISYAFHAVGGCAYSIMRWAQHEAGEDEKTISTMTHGILRQASYLAETVFHGIMVALRVAAHIAGEVAATVATAAYAVIRAMYHAIVAAIAAIESEASVPYVGVALGIAAGAAIMAAAVALMGGFSGRWLYW